MADEFDMLLTLLIRFLNYMVCPTFLNAFNVSSDFSIFLSKLQPYRNLINS